MLTHDDLELLRAEVRDCVPGDEIEIAARDAAIAMSDDVADSLSAWKVHGDPLGRHTRRVAVFLGLCRALICAVPGRLVAAYCGEGREMVKRVTVNLGDVNVVNESVAVARGKAVIAALETAESALLDTDSTSGDESVWAELTAYLGRRGVSVVYDHDAGYPVARAAR